MFKNISQGPAHAVVDTTVRIRPATRKDHRRILMLATAFAAQAPLCGPVDRQCLAALVTALRDYDSACLLVAEVDGEVEGFLGAELLRWFLNPAVVFVHERALYVTPEAQGQGLAAKLIAALEAWAHTQGAAAVLLSGFAGMPHVERLYAKHGYRPLETHYLKEM